jgi:hypothetical protein
MDHQVGETVRVGDTVVHLNYDSLKKITVAPGTNGIRHQAAP